MRDSFGDVGSFSDKAIRRGFIRKVRFKDIIQLLTDVEVDMECY